METRCRCAAPDPARYSHSVNINTQSFWVLTVLTGGPQHGYGLLKEIEILSEGTTCPQVGALYRTIDRLGADGYIEIDSEETVDGRLRRYYRITDDGRAQLIEAVEEVTTMADVARARLSTKGPRRAAKPTIRPSLGTAFA